MSFKETLRHERHYDQRVVSCYPERPRNLDAMLAEAVQGNPNGLALVDGETRLTYAQFDEEVSRVAGGLAARGVGPGDRVALILGNGAPYLVICFAVARLGAVLVPLSIREQVPGIRHALTQSGARLLVVEEGLTGIVPPPGDTPALKSRFAIGGAEGFEDYALLREAAPRTTPSEAGEEDVRNARKLVMP